LIILLLQEVAVQALALEVVEVQAAIEQLLASLLRQEPHTLLL
jgi:hypothetical protein